MGVKLTCTVRNKRDSSNYVTSGITLLKVKETEEMKELPCFFNVFQSISLKIRMPFIYMDHVKFVAFRRKMVNMK